MTSREGPCSVAECTNPIWSRGWCRKHYMRWWEHGDPTFAHFVPAASGEPRAFLDNLPLEGEGCVTWPYATNNMGYGQVNLGHGRKALANRIVCERKNGPPPTDKHQAAHTCGKGHLGCVAPWHLVWKTALENNADMVIHGTRSFGERHHAKLTEAKVIEIRRLSGVVSQSKLAAKYGVTQTLISRIVLRKLWKHVA